MHQPISTQFQPLKLTHAVVIIAVYNYVQNVCYIYWFLDADGGLFLVRRAAGGQISGLHRLVIHTYIASTHPFSGGDEEDWEGEE